MSPLQSAKLALMGHTHLDKDALHVYVGMALFLSAALLLRWPLRSWKPWGVVLAGAFVGELWDLRDSLLYGTPIMLLGNLKDVLNTLFWPTVLTLLARFTPVLARR